MSFDFLPIRKAGLPKEGWLKRVRSSSALGICPSQYFLLCERTRQAMSIASLDLSRCLLRTSFGDRNQRLNTFGWSNRGDLTGRLKGSSTMEMPHLSRESGFHIDRAGFQSIFLLRNLLLEAP